MYNFLIRGIKGVGLDQHIVQVLRKTFPQVIIKNSKIGQTCRIDNGAIVTNSELADNIHVSPNAYIRNSTIDLYSSIGIGSILFNSNIGKYCAVSWYCVIGALSHPYNTFANCEYIPKWANDNNKPTEGKRTIIGNDVWIGANSIIRSNVIVGHGAIIGAGAVVTKDVPPYAVVVGVPAKILKFRFKPDVIEKLLEIAWWNWDIDKIKANAHLLTNEVTPSSLALIE